MFTDNGHPGRPILTRFDEIQETKLEWLWPGRIPQGRLTLLVGDPGLGKSYVVFDMMSRISTGTAWPDTRDTVNIRGDCVYVGCEDDAADTIKPRLRSLGADMTRCWIFDGVQYNKADGGTTEVAFNVGAHIKVLDDVLHDVPKARMIAIDPISAYLGRVDSHVNAEVRGVLGPLADWAAQHRVTVICVSHLNKGQGPAMARAMGSMAFIAAARAAWAVARDKEQSDRRLVVPLKMNLAPEPQGLSYRIGPSEEDPDIGVIYWDDGTVDVDADTALTWSQGQDRSAREEAVRFLLSELNDGPKPPDEVWNAARQAMITRRTLERAKAELRIRSVKADFGGGWRWELPPENKTPF